MNFNLFSQISKIVGRQINNISKKITRLLKLASKPMVYLNTYVRAQVKAMTRPPASKADYVRFGSIYLSKRFLGLSVTGIVAVCTVFSAFVYPWMEGRLWTPTMTLNSGKMAGYTGKAKIENQVGQLIYLGDVEQGQLTGYALQYDNQGQLVYEGDFQSGAYEGSGKLYVDGVLRYEGGFAQNLYEGEGRLYDEAGNLIYQGDFLQGLFEGTGMEYSPETHKMVYQGDFAGGVREGNGVLYEEDGETVAYRGQFAAGVFEGQGSAYVGGVLVYQGNFSQGLYEGEGTLYDEKGSILYQGQFVQGSRQGAGTVYDQVGSAVYSGEFVDDGVNYMSYLGKGTEEITAAFGAPGYQTQAGGYTLLSYLNLGASFLCAHGGDGTLVCRFVLMDANQGFLGITPASTEEELESLLGTRFTTLTGNLTQERIQAVSQLSLSVPEKGRVDKYLMSNYYIKVYYNAQDQIAAVECGGY